MFDVSRVAGEFHPPAAMSPNNLELNNNMEMMSEKDYMTQAVAEDTCDLEARRICASIPIPVQEIMDAEGLSAASR